jgi:hypothetical protein
VRIHKGRFFSGIGKAGPDGLRSERSDGLLQGRLAEHGSGCTSCGLGALARAQLEEKIE